MEYPSAEMNKRKTTCVFSGKVIDALTDQPIPRVMIYISDEKTGALISHAVTDAQGTFLTRMCEGPYTITVLRQGYRPFVLHHVFEELSKKQLVVALSTHPAAETKLHAVLRVIDHLLSTGFELIIILSVILALSASATLGVGRVLPIVIVAFINLSAWILHNRREV